MCWRWMPAIEHEQKKVPVLTEPTFQEGARQETERQHVTYAKCSEEKLSKVKKTENHAKDIWGQDAPLSRAI